MAIFWNCDVTLCMADIDGDYIVGNLKKEKIEDVWNCDKIKNVKELHQEGRFEDLPLCSVCDW